VTYLLDVNALLALGLHEHEFHARLARWVAALGTADGLTTCAITGGCPAGGHAHRLRARRHPFRAKQSFARYGIPKRSLGTRAERNRLLERIHDPHRAIHLPIVHVLGQDFRAAAGPRGGDDGGIPVGDLKPVLGREGVIEDGQGWVKKRRHARTNPVASSCISRSARVACT